jgi:hypothetical protein
MVRAAAAETESESEAEHHAGISRTHAPRYLSYANFLGETAMKSIIKSILLLTISGAALARPIQTYYITDQGNALNPSVIWAIKGSSFEKTPMTNAGKEAGIAIVGKEVRTIGFNSSESGSGYSGVPDLTLSPNGNSYSSPAAQTTFPDGTSYGGYNYTVGRNGNDGGWVYRFDSSWSNPTRLFRLQDPSNQNWVGITYDPWTQSLWFNNSQRGTDLLADLVNYSLDGTLKNSFTIQRGLWALAMDVDRTLWLTSFTGGPASPSNGILYRYSTNGTLLGTEALAADAKDRPIAALGGEIAIGEIPEIDALAGTGALTLLGFGLALAGERRRPAA